MADISLEKITDKQLTAKGVVALADKPNSTSSYGQGGLSAAALKAWFDNLGNLLAKKINEIIDVINGEGGGSSIGISGLDDDISTLADLIAAIKDGRLAALLGAYEASGDTTTDNLQNIIYSFSAQLSKLSSTTKGDTGEDGDDGVGIKSIALTKTSGLVDTYTIYLTDGTSYNFTVTNGEDGADGRGTYTGIVITNSSPSTGATATVATWSTTPTADCDVVLLWTYPSTSSLNISYIVTGTYSVSNKYVTVSQFVPITAVGISSIEKTSTSGLVDTYTITLTDGSTSTFTVTNGADGADGADGSSGSGSDYEPYYVDLGSGFSSGYTSDDNEISNSDYKALNADLNSYVIINGYVLRRVYPSSGSDSVQLIFTAIKGTTSYKVVLDTDYKNFTYTEYNTSSSSSSSSVSAAVETDDDGNVILVLGGGN